MGKVTAPICQVFPYDEFVAFSCTMGNWWGNSCISHMTKYAIEWESNGKKARTRWEKYNYQFHTMGFVAFSRAVGNLWGNPYISHMLKYTIEWKKSTHIMGKVWLSISQSFPIPWVLLHFPVLWKVYGETRAVPIWWHRLISLCVSGGFLNFHCLILFTKHSWSILECFSFLKDSTMWLLIVFSRGKIAFFRRNSASLKYFILYHSVWTSTHFINTSYDAHIAINFCN